MSTSLRVSGTATKTNSLHSRFEALLPRLERHGQVYFRDVKCRVKREDCIAEMIALIWKWVVRLAEKGKDGFCFPMALANYAARAVKCGRRLCGQEKARDVMNPIAQQRLGFAVGKLPDYSTLDGSPLEGALIDNTRTEIPEQVCFRIDFPTWLSFLSERNRRVLENMAMGERTTHLSRKFGISPARVSQLRREFHHEWMVFCDELPAPGMA